MFNYFGEGIDFGEGIGYECLFLQSKGRREIFSISSMLNISIIF